MSGLITPIGGNPDINALKAYCLAFCNTQPGNTNELAFAKTKLEEMIFYLRRHRELVGAVLTPHENDAA